ncbi:hypothetical protein Poly21_14240 [Allorhodopirellula heiligendammensis]|uniref:Uncharacterized protein n=1 Tax=Allorhodopirellula heiligendammensis TaxID=2714739 RepID=A0A5C6C576_9BACT|nr:hypothetical protein Poly21_14240 [Allorhodopirellula heiligendammensis]
MRRTWTERFLRVLIRFANATYRVAFGRAKANVQDCEFLTGSVIQLIDGD